MLQKLNKLTKILLCCSVVFLASCASQKQADIVCPIIHIEKATASATYFKDAKSKGLVDRVFFTKITGYKGSCSYAKDNSSITLALNVEFEAELGAAAKERRHKVSYFVAIPEFYPSPLAKQVFDFDLTFPKNHNRIDYRDEEVNITIPLPEGKNATDYTIYIGMQLSDKMLKYNRTLK